MATSIMVDAVGRSKEDREALREQRDALNAEAAENWGDPEWMKAATEEIASTILFGFDHENLLQLLTTVENAPFDARVTVKEVRGLKAFWTARGGYIEASEMRSDVFELPRDMIGFHVFESEDKLRVNFAETQATLVELGIKRMDAEVNLRVLRTMQAAIPSTASQYITGAFSLTALDTAIDEVIDESRSNVITIVGRRTMTGKIVNALSQAGTYGGFIPETNQEIISKGILGTYKGATITTLINYKDDEDHPFFPGNELFVVGADASKFAFWGGLFSKEWTEDDNWYWHYLARRDFGGVVHRPERIRRFVDPTQTP